MARLLCLDRFQQGLQIGALVGDRVTQGEVIEQDGQGDDHQQEQQDQEYDLRRAYREAARLSKAVGYYDNIHRVSLARFLFALMTSSRIGDLLDAVSDVQALTRQVRRLIALAEHVRAVLPAELSTSISVASFREGRLALVTENGAAAAKLRHLAPHLLRSLARRDPDVTAIQVRVQVTKRVKPLPLKRKSLGPEVRAEFQALAGRLPPSSLRQAVSRVANPRSVASDYEQEAFEGEKSQEHKQQE